MPRRPAAACSVNGTPLMNSIAKKGRSCPRSSGTVPASYTCAMPGCWRRPSTADSSPKRLSISADRYPARMTLSATVRLGFSWRAS